MDGEVDMTQVTALDISQISFGPKGERNGNNDIGKKLGLFGNPSSIAHKDSINQNRMKRFMSNHDDFLKRKKFESWHKISSGIWERNMFIFYAGGR